MRIAYVCADPGVPVFGRKGGAVHVQELVRAFQNQGARVELFAARLGDAPLPGLASLRAHSLPTVRDGDPEGHARTVAAFNAHLRTALAREGRYDMIYERYSLWSYAAMEHARATGVPGLLEVNAPLVAEQSAYRGLRDRTGAEETTVRTFQAAAALVAVSREVRAWLERYPPAQGRTHEIANGVDAARFRPDIPPTAPSPGAFTVGFSGSMKPWHGLDALIEAFARLHARAPATRLLLVGDGPARAALEAAASARALAGAVHVTGAVPPSEVPGLLTSMDAAVAPYPETERFYFSPLKVYEYMAAGRAVVASRVGQLTDLVRHDVNGLVCTPGDPGELAAALDRLRLEPRLRARLGAAARASVLEHHTWDGVAKRILGLVPSIGRRRELAVSVRA